MELTKGFAGFHQSLIDFNLSLMKGKKNMCQTKLYRASKDKVNGLNRIKL